VGALGGVGEVEQRGVGSKGVGLHSGEGEGNPWAGKVREGGGRDRQGQDRSFSFCFRFCFCASGRVRLGSGIRHFDGEVLPLHFTHELITGVALQPDIQAVRTLEDIVQSHKL